MVSQPERTKAEALTQRADLPDVLQGLCPGLVKVGEDRPRQLELATGLEGDVGAIPGQGDDVLAFVERGPAKFSDESAEQGLDIA